MLKNESVSYSTSKCVLCMKADDALLPIFISSFQVHYARQFQAICTLWHLKMFPLHGVADASFFFFLRLQQVGVEGFQLMFSLMGGLGNLIES